MLNYAAPLSFIYTVVSEETKLFQDICDLCIFRKDPQTEGIFLGGVLWLVFNYCNILLREASVEKPSLLEMLTRESKTWKNLRQFLYA